MTYQSEVMADSPALYLKLDETAGATTAVDSSGNSHDIPAANVTWAQTSLLGDGTGTSATFNGTNALLSQSSVNSTWMDSGTLTYELRAKWDGTQQWLGGRWNGGSADPWLFYITAAGNLTVQIDNGAVVVTGTSTLVSGTTYTLALRTDGTTVQVFVNGVSDGSATHAGPTQTNSAFEVARASLATFSTLAADEISFYLTALSDARLAAHHAAAVAGGVQAGAAALTATSTFGAAAVVTRPAAVALVATSTLGATVDGVVAAAAALSATSTLTAGAGASRAGAVAMVAVSTLTAAATVVSPPAPPTPTMNQYGLGGRRRLGTGQVVWEPAVVDVPATVREIVQYIAALVIDTQTGVGPERVYETRLQQRYRSRHRVIVNHQDVTYFRGVETPEPTWTLMAPGLYGPGRISFPQIGSDEATGVGDLAWLTPWAPVHVQRVRADGTRTTDYRGTLSDFDYDGPTFGSTLAGQLTGRAATQYRPPPVFRRQHDISDMIKTMVRYHLHLGCRGPSMGIQIAQTGGKTQADWLNEVMALSQLKDGTAWTLMPTDSDDTYHIVQKDLTTIHYTLYTDDTRTVPHLRRDFAEEPNREYADAISPGGLRIRFATYPGMQFGPRPAYPMAGGASMPPGTTDAATTTGAGVTTLIWRLGILGFIDGVDKRGYLYDDEVTDGVERAQRRADLLDGPVDGITTTPGTVNPITWRALWSLQDTGASLRGSHIRPAAQLSSVMRYRVNASGQRVAFNPKYDPQLHIVDQMTSMGAGRKRRQVERWAQRELHDGHTPNYVGSLDVTMGAVIDGEHNPGDPFTSGMLVDARDVKPNRNVWLPNFQGGTLLHISAIDKGDGSVTLTVDTRARDAMKVWQVIDRNIESRQDPARNFLNGTLSSRQTVDQVTPWDDIGGIVDNLVVCPANTWTVFKVIAGQEGQVRDFDITLSNAHPEFVVAAFGRPINSAALTQLVPHPLTDDGRRDWRRKHHELTTRHFLLYAAGVVDNPAGFHPTTKPEAPLDFPAKTPTEVRTGRFKDEAGFPFYCDGEPVIRMAVFPDRDCQIDPGRIFVVQQNDI